MQERRRMPGQLLDSDYPRGPTNTSRIFGHPCKKGPPAAEIATTQGQFVDGRRPLHYRGEELTGKS